MAGVYIKGMEMPECCEDCKLFNVDYDACNYLNYPVGYEYSNKRMEDCPLVAVPDHGDFIDKSVLYDHIKEGYDIDFQEDQTLLNAILEIVDYQEAVIPADKEEV